MKVFLHNKDGTIIEQMLEPGEIDFPYVYLDRGTVKAYIYNGTGRDGYEYIESVYRMVRGSDD